MDDDAAFCTRCGEQPRRCAECAKPLDRDAAFCTRWGARLVAAEESAPPSGKSEEPSEPDEHAMEPDEHAVAAEPPFRASGAHASPERERGPRAHGADASSERAQAPRASGAHAPERPATPRTRAMALISGLAGIAALLSTAGRWNEISFANATCHSGRPLGVSAARAARRGHRPRGGRRRRARDRDRGRARRDRRRRRRGAARAPIGVTT